MDFKLFVLGKIVATRAVFECFKTEVLQALLKRHQTGDWGQLSDTDWESNRQATVYGGRILSRYSLDGETLLVITEADRSTTTILFPYEY